MLVLKLHTFLCAFASDLKKDGFSWEKDSHPTPALSSPEHAAKYFAGWHTEYDDDDLDANIWCIAVLNQDTGEITFWDVSADLTYTAYPAEE